MDFSIREAVPEVTYLYPAVAAAWVLMGRQPVYVAARPEERPPERVDSLGLGLRASVRRPARRAGSRTLAGEPVADRNLILFAPVKQELSKSQVEV